MLANWVRQSTSTVGTGDIVLDGAPDSGFIAFSTAFRDGEAVEYTIEDGANKEIGQGVLTSGVNWTLTRSIIFEKLEGGVFSRKPSTALSLSGSAVISVSASQLSMFATPYTHTAADGLFSGNAFGSSHMTGVTVRAFSADRIYLAPYLALAKIRANGINIRVATASTVGTKFRCGVYQMLVNAKPGELLAQTGDIDSTITGNISATFLSGSLWLTPGWYYLGYLTDSDVSISSYTFNGHLITPLGSRYTGEKYTGLYTGVASGWTSLPQNFSGVTTFNVTSGNYFPYFGLLRE